MRRVVVLAGERFRGRLCIRKDSTALAIAAVLVCKAEQAWWRTEKSTGQASGTRHEIAVTITGLNRTRTPTRTRNRVSYSRSGGGVKRLALIEYELRVRV